MKKSNPILSWNNYNDVAEFAVIIFNIAVIGLPLWLLFYFHFLLNYDWLIAGFFAFGYFLVQWAFSLIGWHYFAFFFVFLPLCAYFGLN
ncbi:hypothetical protein A4G18_07475 [Pasteurellaceae bacterium Pebbles2]|nr:hypothetical protein [Pasteurellaceae bacterium Pebbles2]